MIKRVREVAYELKLSNNSRIHNVFHASRLKTFLGQHAIPCVEIPSLNDEGQHNPELQVILDTREKVLRIEW